MRHDSSRTGWAIGSHNPSSSSSLFEDDDEDRGLDPIDIGDVATMDLPRPSIVRHSTLDVVFGGDEASDDAALLTMRRHEALCFG